MSMKHEPTRAALQTENQALRQRIAELEQRLTAADPALPAENQITTQHLLERTFASLRDAIFIIDADTIRIVDCNPAASTIFGYPREAMIGHPPNFLHVNDAALETFRQHLYPALREHGYLFLPFFTMRRNDGTIFSTEHTVAPLYDHHGTHMGWVSVIRDISEQVRTAEIYRTLVETTPSAIVLIDMDGTIRFCNPQAAHLFGYTSTDELIGTYGTDLVASDDLLANPLAYAEHLGTMDDRRNIKYTMHKRDGETFSAEVNSSIVTDGQNNPLALIAVVRDITEREQAAHSMQLAYASLKELNDDLRHSRNLLRVLFDGLHDGFLLLDPEGHIQTMNHAMAELLGTTPEELVGSRFAGEAVGLNLDTVLARANATTDSGDMRRHHVRYRGPDGSIRILNTQTIALYAPPAYRKLRQIIVHVVDVTENVQMQARMIENERFAASGRLAASVAHEINTPLQALYNSLDLLRIAPDEDRQTFLSYALNEMKRIRRIVRQLLDLYRPTAASLSQVNIPMLLERILLLIGKRIRDQDVTVETDIAPQMPLIAGHEDELMQVLLNLIVNALDAMPEGGTLSVACQTAMPDSAPTTDERFITITIRDTGYGIKRDMLERIFDPFVTTREEGTGLGLAISHQIVQQHEGTIQVTSTPGQGSTFTVALPVIYDT